MRILRLNCATTDYLEYFYRQHPYLDAATFSDQSLGLSADYGYQAGNAWVDALAAHDVAAEEFCATNRRAQVAWAEEHGCSYGSRTWIEDIALAQIRRFEPTLVFIGDFGVVSPAWLRRIRYECNSIHQVVGWCGAPGASLQELQEYDLIFSCVPELVDGLRKQGLSVHLLHHGFDDRVLRYLPEVAVPEPTLAFTGQIVGGGVHGMRQEVLSRLAESGVPLRIYTDSPVDARSIRVRRRLRYIADRLRPASRGRPAERPPARSLYAAVRPALYGVEMFSAARRSAATLNIHLDVASRYVSNRRMWEVTGAGGCLLTDHKTDLPTYFVPGYEVLSFSSPGEAVELANAVLADPSLRRRVSQAGQARTLRDHTHRRRVAEFMDIVTR